MLVANNEGERISIDKWPKELFDFKEKEMESVFMSKYRILVIDDVRTIRLSLKMLFQKIDAEVMELDNAEELFQSTWRYQNMDLIILDIELPGMSGMTALVKIKEDKRWSDVPLIMLTSHASKVVIQQAIHTGIVDYIRKPFVGEELLNRVKKILNVPITEE